MGKKKKDKFDGVPIREQFKPIFRERFLEMLGNNESEYEKLLDYLVMPQKKSFRINTIKDRTTDEIFENLKNKNLKLTPVSWSKNAYFVEYDKNDETCRSDLGNLVEHFLGEIYVQEATSMTPPELLEIPDKIDDDFMVLDMCSAPGSKTTQIGMMMKNKGVLVANELDYKRLGPLKINLERSGLSNVVIINNDGCMINGEEKFDRICLDAPCSGSGVIRKSPKTIKTYNPKKLKMIQNIQLKLLDRASELLKTGGIMTYSTCSMDPEENELCIQKFMEKHPEMELVKAELPSLILNNKLKSFQGVDILPEITEKTIRIWPQDNDTNGFYAAKFVKKNIEG